MTIMTEQDMSDYLNIRAGREAWIEACYAGAAAIGGERKPGPAIALRDQAAATVIDQALQAAREEERAAVVKWLRTHPYWSAAVFAEFIEAGKHRREG